MSLIIGGILRPALAWRQRLAICIPTQRRM